MAPTAAPAKAGRNQPGTFVRVHAAWVNRIPRMKMTATTAHTKPRMAKPGSSRNENTVESEMTKAGKSPKWTQATMVPATEAITTGAKALSA